MASTFKPPDELVVEHEDDIPAVERTLDIVACWNPSRFGRSPRGVAATATYVAARYADDAALTQKEACEIFGSSPMTIRKQQAEAARTAREHGVFDDV